MNSYIDIKKLYLMLDGKRKSQLKKLLLLMTISSLAELLSIGSALPFLSILIYPEKFLNINFSIFFFNSIGIPDKDSQVSFIIISFGILAVVTGIIRLLVIRLNTKISFEIGSEIAEKIYDFVLHQSYRL